MDPQEDLWIERATRYNITLEVSLHPLRQNLPFPIFTKLYEEESKDWKKVLTTVPGMMFTPYNQQAQEVFYRNLDAICATLDLVDKDDWKAYVPLLLFNVFFVLTSFQSSPYLLCCPDRILVYHGRRQSVSRRF